MPDYNKIIRDLKKKLADKQKLHPTGKYNVIIKNAKGTPVHTFEAPNQRAAILRRNDFYKVLVIKLKQKAFISVLPEMKKAK